MLGAPITQKLVHANIVKMLEHVIKNLIEIICQEKKALLRNAHKITSPFLKFYFRFLFVET
jgi:hypothetical protein